ncbi:MAG: hypothetical protein HN736_12705 [Anaerolineae bacterium]|jgi:hypothetical protein|nr:hypothetical protein [Anaerolineae bacterium]MBT3713565.1 hypothetical protein [Anaerolineae bacterium]MBT4311242.1 hypothetical protein [Anaerolineae bacterium]MBT4459973.1 hypothetical protein [Anaerolineae bacterium]MBT4843576.1 hypothetical protein [Anaerolineae bacterium]
MKSSSYSSEYNILTKKFYTRVALILIGVATFLLAACAPDIPPVPQPAPVIPAIEAPSVVIGAPSRQEASPTPDVTPAATQELSTPASDTQYCDLFNNMIISVIYLDWMRDTPLEFYFKMPGGVPGLEKAIPDTSNTWEYSGKIGDHLTSNCEFVSGYVERLYCKVNLPAEYAYTARELSLSLKGCEQPVYTDPATTVPGFIN